MMTHKSVSQADGKLDTLVALSSGAQCNRAAEAIQKTPRG
jgi:hypothetical protein